MKLLIHIIASGVLAFASVSSSIAQNLSKSLPKARIPEGAITKLSAVQSLVDGLGAKSNEDFNRKFAASMAFTETQIRIDGPVAGTPAYGANNLSANSTALNKFIGQSPKGSLANDEEYNRNFRALIYAGQQDERIFGGKEALPLEMRDCVAIGNSTKYFATGTLVADRIVLTAAHVGRASKPTKIFIGSSLLLPGREVRVQAVIPHDPATIAPGSTKDGLLLLILAEKITDVDPRKLPPSPMPASFPWGSDDPRLKILRIAGFGANSADGTSGFGIKRIADVPTAGNLPDVYGFDPISEFAAGFDDLRIDSCKGDSGGPALVYLTEPGDYFLVGCTSRATASGNEACGDGGNYIRTDTAAIRKWIKEQALAAGVDFQQQ